MTDRIKQFFLNQRENFRSVNKLHLVYVLIIFLNSFTFGVTVSIFGVTMEDIRIIYYAGPKVMPIMMIANSAGYVIGTLIGPLYKWLNRQLVIGFFTLLLALTTTFIPLYNPIGLGFVALTIQGICMGVYASSFQIWFRQMFPQTLNSLLNINQFCYGIGTIAAPAIAGRFLFGKHDVEITVRRNSVLIPYIITGVLQTIASSTLFILFVIKRYHEPQTEQQVQESSSTENIVKAESQTRLDSRLSPGLSIEKPVSWRKCKLALCTLSLAVYYTSENGYLPYESTMWQNLPIALTSVQAANVQTVLSLFYTVGPVITALVSLKLSPDVIISYHFGFLLTGLAMLYFGQMSMSWIYVGSAIFGYGMSSMVSSTYAFADRHFKLNNQVTTVFSLTNGTFFLTISSILTMFTLADYPQVLFIIVFGYIALSLFLFILIRLWIVFSK